MLAPFVEMLLVEAVRDALEPYVTAEGVRLDGAVWLVTAASEA